MYNGIKYAFMFSIGAALGALVTWQYLKPKYERMVQDEVNEFKKDWSDSNREGDSMECLEADYEDSEGYSVPELNALASENEDIIMREKYAKVLEKGGSKSMSDDDPYVISPLKFAEENEYDVISLTYYADGILVDDAGDPIENVAHVVGLEFPEHFGEYTEDPDTVYVRNERLQTDYEIQRDLDNYAKSANPAEDE